jgi:hypothetical protein
MMSRPPPPTPLTTPTLELASGRRIHASPPRGPATSRGRPVPGAPRVGYPSRAAPRRLTPTTSRWPTTCRGRRSSFIAARAAAASPVAGFVERA